MPEISVIVPVYKVEKYIHRCVDSILSQSFSDLELILVDDGSPDGCSAICDEYAHRDIRVRVFHQQNQGVSAARNFGLDWVLNNSNSEWISFVDSDDWCHPKMLELLHDAVVYSGLNVSACGYVNTQGEEPNVDFSNISATPMSTEQFFVNNNTGFIVPWGKLYRKSAFKNIRYPLGKRFEDEYTTYRVLFQFEQIAYVNSSLYFYLNNPDSFMHMDWSLSRLDYFNAAKEQVSFFEAIGKAEAKMKSIRLYLWSLLGQHWLYQQGICTKEADRAFQKLAWFYVKNYWGEIEVDTERKVHLFWMMYPHFSKLYHAIKRRVSGEKLCL